MAKLLLDGIFKQLGNKPVVVDLNLELASGELVCLLGPSGCGKTTTLRMIAGFLTPDRGRILLDGAPITHLPSEKRPTAMVFQQYALWPHMDVFHNVAFGLQLRHLPKSTVHERVSEVLKLVRLEGYERSYPAQLSGGQQQRVALARALVLEPALLLLDEPLSNLDTKLREQVREEIREIQHRVGITTIFVTHDQDEALSISDRVAVLAEGHLEQFATPDALYKTPATLYVASFIGTMNIFSGVIRGQQRVEIDGVSVDCKQISAQVEGKVAIAVRPEDIRFTDEGILARIKQHIPRGHYQEVVLEAPFGDVRAFVSNDTCLGEQMPFVFQRALIYQDGKLLREVAPVLS